MDYQEVIQDISRGLSGDSKLDIPYLMRIGQQYKDHPQSEEILREIGRMIYAIVPKEDKANFEQAISKKATLDSKTIADAKQCIDQGNLDRADALLDGLLTDARGWDSDSQTLYCAFRNPLEAAFYDEKYHPSRKLRIPPFPFNDVYGLKVYLLVEKKDYSQALRLIDIAVQCNPLFGNILFEKAEIYKFQNNMPAYIETTRQILGMLYLKPEIARYFRNLGFYLVEKEKWDEATAAYFISLYWDQSEKALQELAYIEQKTGKAPNLDNYPDPIGMLSNLGFDTRPDDLWVQLSWAVGQSAEGGKDYAFAAFCYAVTAGLTNDEEAVQRAQYCDQQIK